MRKRPKLAGASRTVLAGDHSRLDEAGTRKRIDQQLRDAGWEADSEHLRFSQGARPRAGRNLAIAEWPTSSGPADYVLFLGLKPVAVVEAKRHITDVAGRVPQARRYSRDFTPCGAEKMPAQPWGEYRIPFVFATNGRPFLRQVQEKSGIWFHDVRRDTNHPRALNGWYTPDGLKSLLAQDPAEAAGALPSTPVNIGSLHDYQIECVGKIEAAIAAGQRAILVAMATGTGKTRVAIALLYRLLKLARFRRILLLVDREALGLQATSRIREVRLENLQTLAEIYDIKELDEVRPDPNTRLHIATIQGMVQRLLYPGRGEPPIPVDQYDCVIVDECHRGYTLDRELPAQELLFKDQADYISKYRRILDHFDAVKIGLTATPALHTTEIFGKPIFTYTYRQAVIDGWLVDHEPPIRLITRLAKHGIHWKKGEPLQVYDPASGTVDLTTAPDQLDFDVEAFNKRVITEPFNQVIARELAAEIDPALLGKTLLFCVNDAHADLVVRLLKDALEARYGPVSDDTVVKITGQADQPLQLIRRYQNEQLPKFAVTVDLLTTGIDIPDIVNLVFLRRLRSRILYEQMLGRATRLCPNLYGPGKDKEAFRIFDAVDLYAALEDFTTMKPVVRDPTTDFSRLVTQLAAAPNATARQTVREELLALFQRKRRRLETAAAQFQALFHQTVPEFVAALHAATPQGTLALFQQASGLAAFLDSLEASRPHRFLVSEHPDAILEKSRGFGKATKPGDYLATFSHWLTRNLNRVPALLVVTQRPRDLTRQHLKEIKQALDDAGFTETSLRTAWREWRNEDIAATIVGYIRNRAMGAPLRPYAERVDHAVQGLLTSRPWSEPQRQWLQRIANQTKADTVVDREALDHGLFRQHGGFARLNRLFDGQVEAILADLRERVWRETAA